MLVTVLFLDGSAARLPIQFYRGAALAGTPTAYVVRQDTVVWIKPGESVDWIEA